MAHISYKKKLDSQFTRYIGGIISLFFCIFTFILFGYTIGLNNYRNAKNNERLSEAFLQGYLQYENFLLAEDTHQMLHRRLLGKITDKYTTYRFSSIQRETGLPSSLILADAQGTIVYDSGAAESRSQHQNYFNRLIQQSLTDLQGVYTTVYHLFEDTGRYVLAIPISDENASISGFAAIYIDGSSWEDLMRRNQFDGVITNGSEHIIAASNWSIIGSLNFFPSDTGRIYESNDERYYVKTSYLSPCDVYIHTLLKVDSTWHYYSIALIALVVLLGTLLLTGQRFARRLANLNAKSVELLHSEITALQNDATHRRIQVHTDDEFEDIADHMNGLLDHLETLSNQNLELGLLNNQMERLRLEAQFDPHFLYNTLDSIRFSVRLGDKDVDKIILKLTALLRYSISAAEEAVTLREDLMHLQDYLAIMQYRFQERFRYEISVAENCLDHPCPRLCIQPIVENSVKYGLQQQQVLTVSIRAREDKEFLYLDVEDDGAGMSPEMLEEMRTVINTGPNIHNIHYGLRNIARRLRLQFGPGSNMELESTPGEGTKVRMKIAHSQEVGP